MHPPMMKAFIQSVSKIVKKVGAFCLVATHSPIIIQEIPHCNVYKINSEHKIENICYKTYGQNLDTLYKNIYGVELQQTGYCALLSKRKNIEGMTRENLLKDNDVKYLGDEAFLRYILIKDEIDNIPRME